MSHTILFMCPHNAVKSVIAVTYFNHLAADLNFHADSAGTEPDDKISPSVIDLLAQEGLAVVSSQPRHVTPDDLANAYRVISLGCPVEALPAGKTESWDDVPLFSQNPLGSRDAIRAHVEQLVAELREQA